VRKAIIRNETMLEDELDDAWPDLDVSLSEDEESCTFGGDLDRAAIR
jgi:hypothetical protein